MPMPMRSSEWKSSRAWDFGEGHGQVNSNGVERVGQSFGAATRGLKPEISWARYAGPEGPLFHGRANSVGEEIRAAHPSPSGRKERLLGMTISSLFFLHPQVLD